MYTLYKVNHHLLLKLFIGLILIAFLLPGLGGYFRREANYAAEVNGQQISSAQLEQAVYLYVNAIHNQNKHKLSNHIQIKIRQQVLYKLIDEMLLAQYADRINVEISNDSIKNTILAIPMFYTNNKFDTRKFRMLVKQMGLTTEQYAKLIRTNLIIKKLLNDLRGVEFLLPAELNRSLAIESQIREARIATFEINTQSAKQLATKDEVKAIYNAHKNRYLLPESFKVSYFFIDPKNVQANITVDQQEIIDWYAQHQEQFTVSAKKRYSIIQSKTEHDAKMILEQLQEGSSNFALLAKSKSTDILSSIKSGDIGWINDDDIIDEIKQAKLNHKGQLSRIIASSIGFFIIRLDDIQPSYIKPLSAVYSNVVENIKTEKAIANYHALQEKVQKKVSDVKTANQNILSLVKDAADDVQLKYTGWFSMDNIPNELNFNEVKQVLLDSSLLTNNIDNIKNYRIINIDDTKFLLFQLIDHKMARVQSLEEVFTQIEQELKRNKAMEQARINVEQVLSELQPGTDIDKENLLRIIGFKFGLPKLFYSSDYDQRNSFIFSLKPPLPDKVSYGITHDSQGNIILVALDRVFSRKLTESEHKLFVKTLNQRMNQILFDSLLVNLRHNAQIKFGNAAAPAP